MWMDQKTVRMELECPRDCCKVYIRVHIHVNSPLSYTWRVDSYIFLLFSYSIRFILVRSCEIKVELSSVRTIFVLLTLPDWKKKKNVHLTLQQRRMGAHCKPFTFVHARQYIPHSETWALCKDAIVTAIFKKGYRKLPINYKPISLLHCLGKVMESVCSLNYISIWLIAS